jgi:hypothetical protein
VPQHPAIDAKTTRGSKPHLVDANMGEVIEVKLFVAVLGAPNLTYAEATATQTMGDLSKAAFPSYAPAFSEPDVAAWVTPSQSLAWCGGPA